MDGMNGNMYWTYQTEINFLTRKLQAILQMNGMNGNMCWMYWTEINFLTRKLHASLGIFFFLMKAALKFRELQISKVLNTNANRISPIPSKIMYTSLR